ncbi:MAG: hypothetical protein JWN86_1806 [Planctomycetota bacterium]|nr:hypothetical protein [Planctomycetota bacterium]
MPVCSVIIPVYGLAEVTRQCLDTLLDAPPGTCDWEIIVVDDASRDATPAVLRRYGEAVRVVTHPENLGFSHACNDGAAVAAGRYLVFLNNDTLPLPGWLDALVAHAEAHTEAAVVGSKLLYPNGTIQHAGMAIDADLEPQHLYLGFPADHPAVNKARKVPMVTGACLLIARATFEAANGFDTRFVNGYEDVDLCLRIGQHGREVHYCPASVLVHLESVSEGRTARDAPNHALYSSRWKPTLSPSDMLFYMEDGLIRLDYRGTTPMTVRLSPELGVLDDSARRPTADRLLAARSRQVFELLKENIKLRIRMGSESRSA